MFWFIAAEIALVAVMLILAPKPQAQKPGSLKDFQIPTADPGRCISVVRGTGLIRGPNVTWYGDLGVKPIRKSAGLFGGSTTVGYKYSLGLHFQICHGPIDYFLELTADDRSFWLGASGTASVTVNAPKLFGGDDTGGGGGITGQLDLYVGDFTQTANDYLVAKLPGNVPAYRGVSGIVARQPYIGNSTYLKPWAIRIQSIYKQWDGGDQWYKAKAGIGVASDDGTQIINADLPDPTPINYYPHSGAMQPTHAAQGRILGEDGKRYAVIQINVPGTSPHYPILYCYDTDTVLFYGASDGYSQSLAQMQADLTSLGLAGAPSSSDFLYISETFAVTDTKYFIVNGFSDALFPTGSELAYLRYKINAVGAIELVDGFIVRASATFNGHYQIINSYGNLNQSTLVDCRIIGDTLYIAGSGQSTTINIHDTILIAFPLSLFGTCDTSLGSYNAFVTTLAHGAMFLYPFGPSYINGQRGCIVEVSGDIGLLAYAGAGAITESGYGNPFFLGGTEYNGNPRLIFAHNSGGFTDFGSAFGLPFPDTLRDSANTLTSNENNDWSGPSFSSYLGKSYVIFTRIYSDDDALVRFKIFSWPDAGLLLDHSGPYYDSGSFTSANFAAVNMFFSPNGNGHLLLQSDKLSGKRLFTDFGPLTTGTLQINPAHFLRELLTARSWGMGYNSSDIDDESFTNAADTLFDEGFGLFINWTDEEKIEEMCKLVLTHINAFCYVSPLTGKFVIKLIRADYDEDTITHLTDDDVVSWDDYAEVSPADSTASLTVTYTNPQTAQDASVTVNNIAMAAQYSDSKGVTNSYPFIPNGLLAARAAQRDLRSLAPGIKSGQITCKRTAGGLYPGAPFKLSSTRITGLADGVVMRVAERSGDGIGDSKIVIKFVQDVFNLPASALVTAGDTQWISPHSEAAPVTIRDVQEASYRDLRDGMGDSDAAALLEANPDGGVFIAAGVAPTADALNAGLDVDSGDGYVEVATLDFAPGGTLTGALTADATDVDIVVANGSYLDLITVGMLGAIGDEIVRVDAVADAAITLGRGCLDTIPAAHSIGAPIIFYDGYSASDGVRYTATEAVNVKMLTVTALDELDVGETPADAVTFGSRAIRPLRPGDVQIEGDGIGPITDPPDPMSVTWAQRNRLTDALSPASWTEADQTPESGQTTTLILLESDRTTEIARVTGLSGTSHSLAHSAFLGAQTAYVKAISERDGYESLTGYTLAVAFVDELSSEQGDEMLSEDGETFFTE